MKLVADESVEGRVVTRLRADGHEVVSISESAPSSPDDLVIEFARGADAIMVTNDTDFGEKVVRDHKAVRGLVLIRLNGMDGNARAARVADIICQRGDTLAGGITVIAMRGIRFRKL
jgi:predicted nuclease of predicted toxin-antitoxin system